MWPLVMYSNYFKIVSTVTFLVLQTVLLQGIFLFNAVIIHYNDYTRYNICSACFLVFLSGCDLKGFTIKNSLTGYSSLLTVKVSITKGSGDMIINVLCYGLPSNRVTLATS